MINRLYISFVFTFLLVFSSGSISQNAAYIITIETSLGSIKCALYEETPMHADNFVELVNDGFYNGILFHRVIQNFMVQTGSPDSKNAPGGAAIGYGGPGYLIPAEFHPALYHKKGAMATARQGDHVNPNRESNGSQFYIVQGKIISNAEMDALEASGDHIPFTEEQRLNYTTIGGTPHLDYEYTVFGGVIEGLDIIDKIASVPTDDLNRPLEDVKILKISVLE